MIRSSRAFVLVLIAALASPRAVLADADPTRTALAEARLYFEIGRAAHQAGDCDQAIRDYTAAFERAGKPGVLFYRAQCWQAKKNKPKAIADYRAFLAAIPGEKVSEEARAALATLEPALKTEQAEQAERQKAEAVSRANAEEAAAKRKLAESEPAAAKKKAEGVAQRKPAESEATKKKTEIEGARSVVEKKIAPEAVVAAAPSEGGRYATEYTPVYQRWWLWTAVGVVVIVAGVGAGVGVSQSNRVPMHPGDNAGSYAVSF